MNIMTGVRAAMRNNPVQAFLSRMLGSRRGPQHERYIICHPMPGVTKGHMDGARIECNDGARYQYINGQAIRLRGKVTSSERRE